MLDIALKFLKDQLNTYLLTRTHSNSNSQEIGQVKMSKLVDDEGKSAITLDNIGLSIINIEEERLFKSQVTEYAYTNGEHLVLEPELKINLYVILAANFKEYDEALKKISSVLMFFQSHSVFTPEQYPDLDPSIEKLVVELQSLNYEQLNQIWAFIGGKQIPSVIYKVRLVCLQDGTPTSIQSPLDRVDTNLHH
ncbi:DUF4255 domain-containing protein [Crocosphaera sp.]|uniref:DUF4255 domain-containing protein n=1 Tax=Crocosphaera sp. TaxID=2729996 RepID=UPI003F22303A|nr:DUF4255 domain-containing protein [Crocosphaera sp.]